MKTFGGIQQIGVGVADAQAAWEWYSRNFGFDIPLIDDSGVAGSMLPYTGNEPRRRRAILALNLQGGGGLEIWQYADRTPVPAAFEPALGDLGLFAAKLRAARPSEAAGRLDAAFESLGAASTIGEGTRTVVRDPLGVEHFFVRDPFGNVFQVVSGPASFAKTRAPVGGVSGAILGVSDLATASRFFREVLGYDRELYRLEGAFDDLRALPGGDGRFRRALLARSEPSAGPFSELLGPSRIELLQVLDRRPRKIFDGRFWGDLGFIHLCFDVQGMDEHKRTCAAAGHPFTVDSNPGGESFDMGQAAGRFAYVEDPDGTLIELVETHRVPIAAKLGWFLDLRHRDPAKALPRWMLKALALGRRHQ